MTTVANDIE